MYNEFEIAYEEIASKDAAGYEPYEVSILLTQAQDLVLKELISSGIENNDTKSLVLGPYIDTVTYEDSDTSEMYPDTKKIAADLSGFWGIVNERLKTSSGSASVEVKPIDHSFFEANRDNPFKQPDSSRYYWRFIEKEGNSSALMVYNPTTIYRYYINYLDKPDPIIVPGTALDTVIDGTTVTADIFNDGLDCAYNSIIHRNIINRAAKIGKAFAGDPQGVQLLSTN
jgi:hypothetical protein